MPLVEVLSLSAYDQYLEKATELAIGLSGRFKPVGLWINTELSEIREELNQRLDYEKLGVLQKAETCERFLDRSDEGCPSVRSFL